MKMNQVIPAIYDSIGQLVETTVYYGFFQIDPNISYYDDIGWW